MLVYSSLAGFLSFYYRHRSKHFYAAVLNLPEPGALNMEGKMGKNIAASSM